MPFALSGEHRDSGGNRWVVRPRVDASARSRLFCFPHAGGGASTYHAWARSNLSTEVCSLQLPGRETRLSEPPVSSLPVLLDGLLRAIGPLLDLPCVFFGHSLGAVLGFETAREMRRRGLPLPRKLIVSGRRAPCSPVNEAPLHPLPDGRFVDELCRRYGGIPRVILDEPELLALFVPALRADLTLLETHAYREEPPLACPIVAVGGVDDPHARDEYLESWRSLTSGPFRIHRMAGGHFYLHDDRAAFLEWLASEIEGPRGERAIP